MALTFRSKGKVEREEEKRTVVYLGGGVSESDGLKRRKIIPHKDCSKLNFDYCLQVLFLYLLLSIAALC